MVYTDNEIRLKNMVTETLKEKNWVELGDVTLVRIPKIKGRTRALEPNKQGTYNIEYIHERWYDPEIRQCRNHKVTIGCVIDDYPDAMIPNENYHTYFDIETGLPKETGEEEKKQSKKKTEEEKEFDKKLRKVLQDIKKYDPNWEEKSRLFGKDSTMDEVKNQIGEGASDNEIEELYEQIQRERERENILKFILRDTADSISNQARKHPDGLVSPYKARKINELLIEIRVRYEGSGYEDLLELVEEPKEYEQDGQKYITGMSYSDVEVLLCRYINVMSCVRVQDRKKKWKDLTT